MRQEICSSADRPYSRYISNNKGNNAILICDYTSSISATITTQNQHCVEPHMASKPEAEDKVAK